MAAHADAIHPGYGFLSEHPEFIRACDDAGVVFIGPPAPELAAVKNKIGALVRARAAGFATTRHSTRSFGEADLDLAQAEAEQLGYPLVVKSCSGGRGRGIRLVRSPERLEEALRLAQAASQAVFGDPHVYLEGAILPSRYVEVQVIGDEYGTLIHLGERDGSIQRNNQKIMEESPAPALNPEQRTQLWRTALAIARLFECRSACTIEFVADTSGRLYFAEIKPRIQVEHPVSEMVTRVDIVREQIRIAAGETLSYTQSDVRLRGVAMQCRINAEDPWNRSLPSPGRVQLFRAPGGPNVRVDTYAYAGCDVPVRYDPLLAKVVVWGSDRDECIWRMRRALGEFAISGIQTNLPLIQRILDEHDFIRGEYTTEFCRRPLLAPRTGERDLRDLAVAAAIAYVGRNKAFRPTTPERVNTGWHHESRRLLG
jgi:acetyl/propionyl-CoA carboxylase alpha subunit